MGDPVTELATRLPSTFGILTELSAAEIEDFEIQAGQKLFTTSSLDRDAYVYLVQIERVSETATTLWILYPDDPQAEPLRAAQTVRVPPTPDTWAEPRAAGKVRALSASRSLFSEDLIKLLGGREPIPGTVSVKNARTGSSWP